MISKVTLLNELYLTHDVCVDIAILIRLYPGMNATHKL